MLQREVKNSIWKQEKKSFCSVICLDLEVYISGQSFRCMLKVNMNFYLQPVCFHNIGLSTKQKQMYNETWFYALGIDHIVKWQYIPEWSHADGGKGMKNKRAWWHQLKRKVVSKAEQVISYTLIHRTCIKEVNRFNSEFMLTLRKVRNSKYTASYLAPTLNSLVRYI